MRTFKHSFIPNTYLQTVGTPGFSLIELMIVVSIIGILSAIAIPTYQNYTRRARFAEVITAAQIFKTAVALGLQEGASLQELSNGTYGIPPEPKPTKNLASIKVKNGVIIATGSALIDHSTYILQPNEDGSFWSVSGTCLDNGFCNA